MAARRRRPPDLPPPRRRSLRRRAGVAVQRAGVGIGMPGSHVRRLRPIRMSQDINIVAEGNSPGHRWCESEIGLATDAIERGQLARACNHLESAHATATRHRDSEMVARIDGHLAVALHLQGDLAAAEILYKKSLHDLEPTGNCRALAIFHRHYADLLRTNDSLEAADKHIRLSVAAQPPASPCAASASAQSTEWNFASPVGSSSWAKSLLPAVTQPAPASYFSAPHPSPNDKTIKANSKKHNAASSRSPNPPHEARPATGTIIS
jgi:MalT-like TPR region